MDPSEQPTSAPVEVFWRRGCPFCAALRRDLRRRGVASTWRDIWSDEEARRFVQDVNGGNETVPTVRVGARVLTNPTGAQVARLLDPAAAAPDSPGSRNARRALSWLPTIGLLVTSEVMARHGLGNESWGVDVLAFGAWWLTRPLRR